jgi:hypothetical protein
LLEQRERRVEKEKGRVRVVGCILKKLTVFGFIPTIQRLLINEEK